MSWTNQSKTETSYTVGLENPNSFAIQKADGTGLIEMANGLGYIEIANQSQKFAIQNKNETTFTPIIKN